MQWTSVAGNLKRTFFASGDTNTKYFILNSKSISGSYATRFEHENPVASAFSNIVLGQAKGATTKNALYISMIARLLRMIFIKP